jgi:transposase
LVQQLAEVEQRLEEIADSDDRIRRVRTIPGVGRKTAEALVTLLDDPHRFKNARQVSSYLGLVPQQYQSGETDRNGRITKRGSRLVRSILLECAWCALRYNDWARLTYQRICGGQKTRKKKAAIALARKIAVVAWSMLKHETDWDPQRMGIDPAPQRESS